jgi:tetratricopeptide (TPR) repeat protein
MVIYYIGLIFVFLLFFIVLFCVLKINKTSRVYFILLMTLVTGVMGFGYYYFGALKPLKSLYAYREIHDLLIGLQNKPNISPEFVDKSLSDLYDNLPKTEYVHAKMGEVYLALNMPVKAQSAYEKAIILNNQNRDYAYGFYYSQSLSYQGELPEKSVQALERLLAVYPKDNGLLNLLAVNYFQSKQFEKAVLYWQKIRSDNPEESQLIQEMIGRAKTQLGQPMLGISPSIKLTVKWASPELKKYPVIFLVVKHPNQAMPILVKKLSVSQDIVLGTEQQFILSNQDAMDPNQGLKLGQKLIVSVRGSISGLAGKSTQDKIVESQALLLNANQIETQIIF